MTTSKSHRPHPVRGSFLTFLLLLTLSSGNAAQDLPGKIRGYKVYRTTIVVVNADAATPEKNPGVIVKVGEPRLVDVGLYGATIEVGAEFTSANQSGAVDLLSFHNFRIHDIPVDIEDYSRPFQFKNDKTTAIPEPVRINFSVLSLPKAVYKELAEGSDKLDITGTVFVFGKFRKMGFTFKRVVPIKIAIKIKNPLRTS